MRPRITLNDEYFPDFRSLERQMGWDDYRTAAEPLLACKREI
jgi:hypothetical protein